MSDKFRNKFRIESTRLKHYDYASDGAYFITICTKNRQHFFGEIIDGVLSESVQSKICSDCWYDLPNHYPNCILDEFVIMPNHVHGIVIIQNPIADIHPGPMDRNIANIPNGTIVANEPVATIVPIVPVVPVGPTVPIVPIIRIVPNVETGLRPVSTGITGMGSAGTGSTGMGSMGTGSMGTGSTATGSIGMGSLGMGSTGTESPAGNIHTNNHRHSVSEIIRAFKSFSARRINEYQGTPGQPFWQPRFHDRIIRNEQELQNIREYIINNPSNWDQDSNRIEMP